MWVNDSFLEDLPFPYFLIKKENGWIIEASLVSQKEFPSTPSFRELIEPSYRSLIDDFFQDSTIVEIEIPLFTSKGQYNYYRVYSYKGTNEHIHLFLFPLTSSISVIKNVLDQIESKFSYVQQEIKENKQYIDQTVMELQEASVSYQHYQNVEKLAAGIAHEIRNPLTTVQGFIQLLKPYLIEIGKEQYADIALDELNRANQIIYEFLNASKPPENNWKPISLNKLVQDISLLYESESILKDIAIVNHFDEDIEIVANHKQLKQVLVNLLKNAMEAIDDREEIDKKGTIHFYTHLENNHVSIIVEDNGCGMSDATLQNLFQPFHTTKEKGTGVGLCVCKKIIDDHHGTITVESTKNIGTVFKIVFPIHKSSINKFQEIVIKE